MTGEHTGRYIYYRGVAAADEPGEGELMPPPVRGQNSLRPAAGFCRLSLGTIRLGG